MIFQETLEVLLECTVVVDIPDLLKIRSSVNMPPDVFVMSENGDC